MLALLENKYLLCIKSIGIQNWYWMKKLQHTVITTGGGGLCYLLLCMYDLMLLHTFFCMGLIVWVDFRILSKCGFNSPEILLYALVSIFGMCDILFSLVIV